MLSWIKKVLGGKKIDYRALVADGAKIIDVRTPAEYVQGHAKSSINIPLDQIAKKAPGLKKEQTYILCCRSGMRSSNAAQQLKSLGFQKVYNAGPWTNLKNL